MQGSTFKVQIVQIVPGVRNMLQPMTSVVNYIPNVGKARTIRLKLEMEARDGRKRCNYNAQCIRYGKDYG